MLWSAGDGSTADEVLDGLSVLTEACLRHGANVLLMTVLEVAQPEPKVEQQRVQLNNLIKQYTEGQAWAAAAAAAQESADGGSDAHQRQAGSGQQQQQGSSSLTPVSRRGSPRVVLFDLASKLTWNGMDEEARWQMWDDGVHLTIDGYDLMGDLVSEALSTLVKQDIGSAAAATAAAGLNGSAGIANGTSDHKKAV
jgi:lysophospholipase L1-like esterase